MSFWDVILDFIEKAPVSRDRVSKNEFGHTVILCSACGSDVVLGHGHWAVPTKAESVRYWQCPPCLNKARKSKGLSPLGRNGQVINNC